MRTPMLGIRQPLKIYTNALRQNAVDRNGYDLRINAVKKRRCDSRLSDFGKRMNAANKRGCDLRMSNYGKRTSAANKNGYWLRTNGFGRRMSVTNLNSWYSRPPQGNVSVPGPPRSSDKLRNPTRSKTQTFMSNSGRWVS